MKTILTTAILASASVAIFTSSASAQIAPSAANADLILGFEISDGAGQGGNTTLEVDLGPVKNFYNAIGSGDNGSNTTPAIQNLNGTLGLVAQDLSNTFGANWATRSDLVFGIIGATAGSSGSGTKDNANSLFVSNPEATAGTQTTPLNRAGAGQGPTDSVITPLYPYLNTSNATPTGNGSTVTAAFGNNATPANTTAGTYTYQEQKAGISNFGQSSTTDQAVTNVGGSSKLDGTKYAVLDLYDLNGPTPRGASGAGLPGAFVGAFGLNSAGNLEFDTNPNDFATSAVPEPSTLALGGVMIGFAALRRFRSRKQA